MRSTLQTRAKIRSFMRSFHKSDSLPVLTNQSRKREINTTISHNQHLC